MHRDIKPANLFLAQRTDESTCIKVLDFGISKLTPTNVIGIETLPVETGIAWGSPQYMSPEQIRASADMDGRTDVWSLGVTLFQLLTRRLPFHGINVQQISAAVLEQPFPSVIEIKPRKIFLTTFWTSFRVPRDRHSCDHISLDLEALDGYW
ncbi:MAG TPA: protein kinase [Polyangium sp.]|nr:protein kinase [Polyangium sp.]